MRLPFVTRRQHDALRAENDRLRAERDDARDDRATAVFNRNQALHQLAEADAANRRLHDRNLELGRRISTLTESDPDHLAGLEKRLALRGKAAARILAAYKAEKRRADRLQKQYDDAVGLNTARGDVGLLDSEHWKPPISLDVRPKPVGGAS